ncbi:integrase dna protein [uncultured Ruegeria sp.]|uniref:tyrosine-type recombinase/integrase n=1 Tax=uncultured Ruegeria sp. TaxID=259304 RepID=UPI00262B5C89|nr:integrase dna protein [uncultured Ruegeria sp.]
MRGARFDEIEGDVWTVPKERMKGERSKLQDFRVPLSTEALSVVEQCRLIAVNDFLFPSSRINKGVSDVAMAKVLNNLNEAGRIHGFRSSFRMWIQDNETASFEVAETALAHTIGNKVERAYARSDLLGKRRILMQKWADYVTQTEAKVVQLRG